MNKENITSSKSQIAARPVAGAPGMSKRYCRRCKLVVADFSNMTDDEIYDYYVSHYNDRVCVSHNSCDSKKNTFSGRLVHWCQNMFGKSRAKSTSVIYSR